MIRNPTMFYYNVMMPPGVPFAYPPMLKATKRRKKKKPFQLHSMHPYKRKRFSLTYYLKYVLWRKIRRYWKKKKTISKSNNKKKKDVTVRPSGASVLTSNRGSSEKIGTRDFWGSKYGSQWLFAKEDIARRGDHNRLVEIVDAFKTSDLKYAQRRKGDDATTTTPRRHHRHKCGCNSRRSDAGSEWSLSTPRPYSKWPPSCGGGGRQQEQLASLLSRQHAYVYNWLYVDQLQGGLPLSRDYLDQVRRRLQELQQQRQQLVGQLEQRRRKRRSSSCASSSSEWGSTLSRRERAKLLKRQVRAKERASVLWLLSKAFDGEIPPDVLEPFYRDKDNVRRLKPKIVHSLANAELYCLALTNIYSDPNYNNLDHHGIVQFLTRKGIPLPESRELPLTETTLVQTAPIRMNAHMAVIGGIMSLYIKEVLIPEKIVEVVGRFSHVDLHNEMPSNSEEAAILWINKCCRALENDIKAECPLEHESRLPKIPVLNDISDVSDGCCIAAVISFYCPNFFRWQDICWNNPISLGDSIHNLQLVKKFCSDFLPREVNFLTMEDLLYLHPSIKDNVLAFIADLLFMFVIRAACVTPRKKTVHHDTSHIPLESSKSLSSFQSHKTQAVCSPIPNLRSDSYGGSTSSLPDITRPGSRARNCGSKERLCEKVLIKKSNFPSDEVGLNELQRTSSVGMVNGWKTNLPHVGSTDSVSSSSRHPDLSRLPAEGESASSQSQPSIYSADDSGLPKSSGHGSRTTLCSQSSPPRESIGFGLRKSSDITLGYRASGDGHTSNEQRRSRKSLEDYYSHLAGADGPLRSISASNITDNHRKKDFGESVPESASSQSSGICLSDVDIKNAFSTTSFAQLSKSREPHGGINITYMPQEGVEKKAKRPEGGKKTTFAALPNTTTWQQVQSGHPPTDSGHETPTDPVDGHLNAQLCNIRMKLEDKKRKIELKKKRMEMLWKKQRQKLGKAAFLQAVSKGAGTPDSGNGEPPEVTAPAAASPSMVKRMSMQEIAADLDCVQKKWLHLGEEPIAAPETDHNSPDFSVEVDGEAVNLDLVTSIEHLNTSLTDLQADISRISLQQEQVENLMKDSIDDGSHFFLHGPTMSDHTFEALSLRPEACYYESPVPRSKQGGFSASSPNRPKAIYHQALDHSTPYASLPPASFNKEDLYSKVIKPDRGQKQQAKPASSPPNRPGDSLAVISNIDHHKKPAKPKAAAEIHVVLPQVPDHKPSVFNNAGSKKSSDETQGFYIPVEKGGRKVKPKVQQKSSANNKVVGGGDVPNPISVNNVPSSSQVEDVNSLGFVIGADLVHPDPETETEMARKKEMIMNLSIQRKAEYERKRIQKEKEYERIKEEERRKQEYHEHKREEEKRRREAILEQYRQRKLAEELEKEKSAMPKEIIGKFTKPRSSIAPVQRRENRMSTAFSKPTVQLRNNLNSSRQQRKELKPRPKSAYVHMNSDLSSLLSMDSTANKRNSHIFPGRDMHEFDLDSLNSASTSASSHDRHKSPNGFHPSHRNSLQIPEGPSSDGASDTASNGSSAAAADYTGPKLFVKPAAKSNRGIIINAINTVLAGAVNADTKKKVLEEINRSESKHFLILFRDAGCQFRAMYTYNPEREEVTKLFGIGPKNVVDKMMERFYKYNSGGKCFSEIQTKHLTVTIDAFTIPNSLWAGKKVIPPKKEFF